LSIGSPRRRQISTILSLSFTFHARRGTLAVDDTLRPAEPPPLPHEPGTIEQHDQLITSVDGLGHGLGVALGDAEGRLFLFKRGGNFGYRSGLIVFPDAGKAAVVMTNGDNGEALVNETLFALLDRLAWPRFDRLPE
jgi:hypothetical protein